MILWFAHLLLLYIYSKTVWVHKAEYIFHSRDSICTIANSLVGYSDVCFCVVICVFGRSSELDGKSVARAILGTVSVRVSSSSSPEMHAPSSPAVPPRLPPCFHVYYSTRVSLHRLGVCEWVRISSHLTPCLLPGRVYNKYSGSQVHTSPDQQQSARSPPTLLQRFALEKGSRGGNFNVMCAATSIFVASFLPRLFLLGFFFISFSELISWGHRHSLLRAQVAGGGWARSFGDRDERSTLLWTLFSRVTARRSRCSDKPAGSAGRSFSFSSVHPWVDTRVLLSHKSSGVSFWLDSWFVNAFPNIRRSNSNVIENFTNYTLSNRLPDHVFD